MPTESTCSGGCGAPLKADLAIASGVPLGMVRLMVVSTTPSTENWMPPETGWIRSIIMKARWQRP